MPSCSKFLLFPQFCPLHNFPCSVFKKTMQVATVLNICKNKPLCNVPNVKCTRTCRILKCISYLCFGRGHSMHTAFDLPVVQSWQWCAMCPYCCRRLGLHGVSGCLSEEWTAYLPVQRVQLQDRTQGKHSAPPARPHGRAAVCVRSLWSLLHT